MKLPYFDDFLLFLQSNNYSLETIYNYERDLKVFDQFLKENNKEFDKIDKRLLNQYKAYLTSTDRKTPQKKQKTKEKLSSLSINRMLSSLRMYFKYLAEEQEYSLPFQWDALKPVKTGKKHPRVAELKDLIRLAEAPIYLESNGKVAVRNRAALETLLATGMRISELLSLNKGQIDPKGRIFITGKGKKQRFVYLTDRAKKYLDQYLVLRRDNAPALFVPFYGRMANNPRKRLSTNYLQERINFYKEKLGINVPTSAHSFRHAYATYLAEEGASPAAIQILLGHESLATTTRYISASDKFAEETHRKYHPVAVPDE